jgi:hypothetical protein
MIGLLCFAVAVLCSPFKSKLRLEAENAVLRQQLIVLRRSFERAMRMSPTDPLLHRALVGMGQAFIELRRFDEAIVAGKKALRQRPFYSRAYRCSRPLSPISDVTLRRVRRRRVCLSSIPPLRYRRGSLGAGNQTQSCSLRVFGKRECPNEPGVSPRPLWRTRGSVNLGGGSRTSSSPFEAEGPGFSS